MAVFEDKKLSNNIIVNYTMSDDEVVASDVPRGTCFLFLGRVVEAPHSQEERLIVQLFHFLQKLF